MTRQVPSSGNVRSFVLASATAACAVGIFIADTITRLEIAIGMLYVAVVLMAARLCQPRGLVLVSLGCTGLIVLSSVLSPPSGPEYTALINASLSILAIAVTTFFIVQNQSAEAHLREQADFLDLTHDAVFSRGLDGTITYWNRGAEELFGWNRTEALGKLSHQLLKKDFPSSLEEANAELLRTGRWEGELVCEKRDGTRIDVASRWSLQRDKDGRPVAVLETNNDVSERKRAEALLRESEEQWREVFEHNPVMYFMVDATSTVLSVNAFGAAQLGYAVNELVGQSMLKVFLEADREFVRRNVTVCLEKPGQPIGWEIRKLRKDGSALWVRENAKAVRRAENQLIVLIACEDITERKRAADALRQSEMYLAEAQRISKTGSFGWSVDSGEIIWSEETFRIFECDQAMRPTLELVRQRIHPEDRALVQRLLDRVSHEGQDWDLEHRLLMPDGSVKDVHAAAHAVKDASGKLEFFGAVTDVSAQKRAEVALRRSEAYLAEAQRLSHTGSWAWNVATREVLHWSQEQYRICGLDPDAGIPAWEEVQQYIHPEDRARCLDSIDRAIREKTDCELDYRSVFPDGTVRYIHSAGHPLFSTSGDVVEFVQTGMDITDRKRAEYLIAQVFEMSPDGISIVGKDYRYRRVNPIYEKNWKLPAERLVGMHLADLLGMEVFEHDVKPRLDRCFAGEEVSYAEWFTNEFGRRFLAVSYSPLRPSSEEVEAALAITRDLTEHMLAAEALQQAQAELVRITRVTALGELAASIAHEVNQPITAVVTNAGTGLRWLAAQPPDLDEARQTFERIIKAGNRASDVIGRIRALVKKAPVLKDRLDINETILEIVALTRSEGERHRVSLQTQLAGDLPLIQGDRIQLQQVILNLIVNALEAVSGVSEGPRELLITSGKDAAKGVLVAVRDSGTGLDSVSLERVFEAFYTTKPDGMGMGLAISRSIIEAHGGRLWATPNVPRGAVFWFTLAVEDRSSPPVVDDGSASTN